MQTKYEQRLDVSLSHMGNINLSYAGSRHNRLKAVPRANGLLKTMIPFKYYNYLLPQYIKITVVNINQNLINFPSVRFKADNHLPRTFNEANHIAQGVGKPAYK